MRVGPVVTLPRVSIIEPARIYEFSKAASSDRVIEPATVNKSTETSAEEASSGSSLALIIGCTVAGVIVLAGMAVLSERGRKKGEAATVIVQAQEEALAPVQIAPVEQDECLVTLPNDVEISLSSPDVEISLSSPDNQIVNRV